MECVCVCIIQALVIDTSFKMKMQNYKPPFNTALLCAAQKERVKKNIFI